MFTKTAWELETCSAFIYILAYALLGIRARLNFTHTFA